MAAPSFAKLCAIAERPRRAEDLFSSGYLNLFLRGLTSPDADVQHAALRALLSLAVRTSRAQHGLITDSIPC